MAGTAADHDGGSGVSWLRLGLGSLLGPNWYGNGYGSGGCSVRHVVAVMGNIKLMYFCI